MDVMRSRRFNSTHCLRMAIAVLALPAALLVALPAASAAAGAVVVGPATRLHKDDQVLGPLAPSTSIHVVVVLNMRDQARLEAYLAKPGASRLTPQQFAQAYAPTAAQANAVADFLRHAGFSGVRIAANRMQVAAEGSAADAQKAFHTRLVSVRTHDGRSAYANTAPIEIPAALSGTVRSVLGLQTVHIMHDIVRPVASNSQQAPQHKSGGGGAVGLWALLGLLGLMAVARRPARA